MSKIALSNARAMFFFAALLVPQLLLASRLHILVRENNVEAVRSYIEGTPRALFELNIQDEHLQTPIQIARALGNEEMVQLLTERGASDYGEIVHSPFKRRGGFDAEPPRSYDPLVPNSPARTTAASAPIEGYARTLEVTSPQLATPSARSAARAAAEADEDSDIGRDHEDPNGGFFFQFDEE